MARIPALGRRNTTTRARPIPVRNSKSFTRFAPIAFAFAGVISRFTIRNVETRFQIVWFWGAALLAQSLLQSRSRVRVSTSLFLLNGAAATFAILLTKFAIEGFPRYVGKLLMQL